MRRAGLRPAMERDIGFATPAGVRIAERLVTVYDGRERYTVVCHRRADVSASRRRELTHGCELARRTLRPEPAR